VIKRLEKRKKHIRKTINKKHRQTYKTIRTKRKKKTNFKTLKPSLLELKIKKKPTKPNPHSEVCAMGIEKKLTSILEVQGSILYREKTRFKSSNALLIIYYSEKNEQKKPQTYKSLLAVRIIFFLLYLLSFSEVYFFLLFDTFLY